MQEINLTGLRVNTFVVQHKGQCGRNPRWLCLCSKCGSIKEILATSLRSGRARCQCTHIHNHDLYPTWRSMINRCTGSKNKDYGGRGITVCDRWQLFENFLEDMGERPEGHTLDRIENNGNYEPGNCKWSTSKEQSANTRKTIILEYNGTKMTVLDWARRLGITRQAMNQRLSKDLPDNIIFKMGRDFSRSGRPRK